jgi:hypothetical protein
MHDQTASCFGAVVLGVSCVWASENCDNIWKAMDDCVREQKSDRTLKLQAVK